jgi:signal peptidase
VTTVPTPTLERPRNIPRRVTHPTAASHPVDDATIALRCATTAATATPPLDVDPAAGLTRAERQALKRARRHWIGDAVFYGLLAVALWFRWPASLGGQATLVLVHGHSMDGYHVGDIVAYHVPQGQAGSGMGVIHRIKRIEGDRFVFQGDNRATEDQWRPRSRDIIGRMVVRIPMLGESAWMLMPWIWCVAIGIAIAWMFWPERGTRRRARAPA